MASSGLRSNGFVFLSIAFGFALILTAIVSGISVALALSHSVPIRSLPNLRAFLFSILADFILPFIGGILLVVLGLKLFNYQHRSLYRSVKIDSKKAAKVERTKVIDSLLSQDEKKMVALIGESKEGMLQSDLVIKSGYSKVKVHRILKGLENKDIIRRGRFGITNKVMLNN